MEATPTQVECGSPLNKDNVRYVHFCCELAHNLAKTNLKLGPSQRPVILVLTDDAQYKATTEDSLWA